MSIDQQQASAFLRVAQTHLRIIEARDEALQAQAEGKGTKKAVDLAQKEVDGSYRILAALMGTTEHGAWQHFEDALGLTHREMGLRPAWRPVKNDGLRDWRNHLTITFARTIQKEFPL